MSYYYDYYIGYINKKDGLVYPFGPFIKKDPDGFKLKPALSYSRSYGYGLEDSFTELPLKMYSEALKAEKTIYSYYSGEYSRNPMYCRVADLPDDSFVKSGYCLIREVDAYLKERDPELICERLDPLVYTAMVESELKFGKRQSDDDDECSYSASDYMYFSYPDTRCVEYHSFILRQQLNYLCELEADDDIEFVIIETEG